MPPSKPHVWAFCIILASFSLALAYATEYDWIASATTSSASAYTGSATYALDTECDGLEGTCAASFCANVASDATCEFTEPASASYETADYVTQMHKYRCRTCTQNVVDPRCTHAWLSANLLTTHSGLKGAFCNDKYLVIFAPIL